MRFRIARPLALAALVAAASWPALAGAQAASNTPWKVIFDGDNLVIVRPNGIAAVVNDKIITIDQVFKEMRDQIQTLWDKSREDFPFSQQAAQQQFAQEFGVLPRQTLQKMVDRLLVIGDFYSQGYTIPKAYIDQSFQEAMLKSFKNDRAAFLNYLQANGMTEGAYRRKLEDDLVYGYMMGKMYDTITAVSPAQVQTYYEQHKELFKQEPAIKLRQIVLKPAANEPRDVLMQEANALVQQARGGADFAELARAKSQDSSAKAGGVFYADWIMLGPQGYGFDEPMESAVAKLKAGEITDPVVDQAGNVRIFKCDEKRDTGYQTLAQVQRAIEGELLKKEAIRAQEKWINKLREKNYWVMNM